MKEFMNSLIMRLGGSKSSSSKDKIIKYLSKMPYGEVATLDTVADEVNMCARHVSSLIDESIKNVYSFKMSHGGTIKRFYANKVTVRNVLKELSKKDLHG